MAADDELGQPPICSATTAGRSNGLCTVKDLGHGEHSLEISLTAASATVDIGGYKVVTENYNGNYLTPVVEALPGDTVAAHLVNALPPASPALAHAGMQHGDPTDNPTNLHYFHGGIVSPKNAVRPKPGDPETGNGDNVYVHLKSGPPGQPNSFRFDVQIPGDKMLDARVLERPGQMSHPVGLNWYHSHQHGISSPQVMGGMSGLLSVGEATANVKAACLTNPDGSLNCSAVEDDTRDLRSRTKARYAILRDIPLKITKLPGEANGDLADFDSSAQALDFSTSRPPCGVWKTDTSKIDVDDVGARTGFCQRDQNSALLFTLNGQRYPTITVAAGQNLLLRLGNLSANLPYWLELQGADGTDGKVLPLTLLSLDGVVPASPVSPDQAQKPVQALNDANLLLMPAARAEIYVRNDEKIHTAQQIYILHSKEHKVNQEVWPAIQLARIVLEPNAAASKTLVALNVPVATIPSQLNANALVRESAELPVGCLRDLDRNSREFRRVTFNQKGMTTGGIPTDWSIKTEIVRPDGAVQKDQATYHPNPQEGADKTTLAGPNGLGGMPFEEFVGADGLVDWTKLHVCIQIDHGLHQGSHKQLWVLVNATRFLHNFHIHQMKFRLATQQELTDDYQILPPRDAHACPDPTSCTGPDYEFYDASTPKDLDPGETRRWHDTIPIPPLKAVFIVMSFDASQQIGRFVFHCHILKHEDSGLMAPIEVWEPKALSQVE